MRLFFYYALHSFKNQLKKLFKTWVLIFFLVCVVLGGLVGVGIAFLSDTAESEPPADISEELELLEEVPSAAERLGVENVQILEAGAAVAAIALLFLCVMTADKSGSKLFLPADVKLLFPSPMKPQSVLMFRLMTQLGMLLISFLYLLFQLPNLVLNFGMSLPAALALLLAFILCIMFGKLLQVLFYLLCSSHPKFKASFHRLLYAFLLLVAAGYLIRMKTSGESYLKAAILYFSAPALRYFPIIGWVKAICGAAMEGSVLVCIGFILLSFGCMGLLLYAVRRTEADFYEDAEQKSEEVAAALEAMQTSKSAVFVKRKKDRPDRIRRDGMKRGAGASVFFWKALYNRFRFAHLGVFTKTMESYMFAAVGVSLLCRFGFQTQSILPPVLALAGCSFFRTLGNPLERDTGMNFFALIPEGCFRKLLCSQLGGTADCLLDVLPALILAGLLQDLQLLPALCWLPFILSVDFFGTAVGCFINLSVPTAAGKNIKQFVQILFIYFGLLPDAAILAVAMVKDFTALGAVAAALFNLLLGLLFLGLTPSILIPGERAAREGFIGSGSLRSARKDYSRSGFGVLTLLVVSSVLQVAALRILQKAGVDLSGILFWLAAFLPMYVIGFPLGILVLRRKERISYETEHFGFGRFIALIPICFFLMYGGNLIGSLVTGVLSSLGVSSVNPLESMLQLDQPLPQFIVTVLCAPVFEELLFRRMLIDRLRPSGERAAVFFSALLFGLFHGNLSQFFYAFLLGLLLGYVYLRSGKLRLTIGLHMIVNLVGGQLPSLILSRISPETMELLESGDYSAIMSAASDPGLIAFGVFILFVAAISILGLILFCVRVSRVHFLPAPEELPRGHGFRVRVVNAGMLLAFAGCLVLMVSSMLQI